MTPLHATIENVSRRGFLNGVVASGPILTSLSRSHPTEL